MIWDMQYDRGFTTLSVWTRGRGAYVWPLPSGPIRDSNARRHAGCYANTNAREPHTYSFCDTTFNTQSYTDIYARHVADSHSISISWFHTNRDSGASGAGPQSLDPDGSSDWG